MQKKPKNTEKKCSRKLSTGKRYAGGHQWQLSFDPRYQVCAVCGMGRKVPGR